MDFDELAEDLFPVDALAALERQHHAVIGLRRSQTVDARDAGDDDDVAPLEERPRGGEPHAVDLVIDRRFLLDIRIGGGNVGFRLVVIVVADEVLDGILGEEAAELLIELGGERLVVGHHQRGAVHPGDALRHGERLPGAGDAEQDLGRVAPLQALDELIDRAALIAAKLEVRDEFEAIVLGSHSVAVQWRLAKRARNAHRTTADGSVRTGKGRRRRRLPSSGLYLLIQWRVAQWFGPDFAAATTERLLLIQALHPIRRGDQRVGASLYGA